MGDFKIGLITIILLNIFILPSTVLLQESGLIIPLYLYPQKTRGEHNWSRLVKAQKKYPIDAWAIMNVENGPGKTKDNEYAEGITVLKDGGVKMLGYVFTHYGNRSEDIVKKDIDTWKTFYGVGVTGIFFDEMANEDNSNLVNYYSHLGQYAKAQGFNFTVGNPGIDTRPEYVDTLDTFFIYESKGFPKKSKIQGKNNWHSKYPRSTWGIIPYGVGKLNENAIIDAKKTVKYIYVTNDDLPNPWDSIPPYIEQLFKTIKA